MTELLRVQLDRGVHLGRSEGLHSVAIYFQMEIKRNHLFENKITRLQEPSL
jgi:hypothetical protein